MREDAPLSFLTIIGTVGVTGTTLAMSVATPVLLPCSILPAVALRYAYGASVEKHEERRRSARVLKYSQVLASGPTREQAGTAFLHMVRDEFDAERWHWCASRTVAAPSWTTRPRTHDR